MTQEQAIECITRALPYPEQNRRWRLSKPGEVEFTWRHNRMRLDCERIKVAEVDDHFEKSTDLALLATELIKRTWVEIEARESAESGV